MKHAILVVEDNEGMGMLLKVKLEKSGYIVHLCSNGIEVEGYLENNTVDLMILDLMIPGLTGWELLDKFQSIPTIIISARSREDDIKRAFKYGNVIDYITKPLRLSILMAKIKMALT